MRVFPRSGTDSHLVRVKQYKFKLIVNLPFMEIQWVHIIMSQKYKTISTYYFYEVETIGVSFYSVNNVNIK